MQYLDLQKLKDPFPWDEVEAKIQYTNKEKTKGFAVFYIQTRAIQKRLDEVCGAFNWKNEFHAWQNNSQLCNISILNPESKEWITKCDGADNSDIEAVKGGLSDAFKRSAVLWGIGRYLYACEGAWVDIEQRGNSSFIKNDQQNILKAAYEKSVAKLFSNTATNTATPAAPAAPQNTSAQPAPEPAKNQGERSEPETPPIYKVESSKPSGKGAQLLELIDPQGEKIQAYVRAGETFNAGMKLNNLTMETRNSQYGPYNLINSYQIAA